MSKNIKKSLITNLILFTVLVGFFSVTVIPNSIVPVYNYINVNPYYNGNKNEKRVSLMFNVYENSDLVCNIVDTLKEFNVNATFFVGGCWADDNEKTLNYILENGNEIGNHGYFHKQHENLSYEQNYNEISNNHKLIKALCDYQMSLFAPPSGSFSENTLEACYDLNYKVIMWSKDTIDWRDKEINKIIKRATNNPKNGDLILMHPKSHTLLALKPIIEYYIDKGFKIVTVSENIS